MKRKLALFLALIGPLATVLFGQIQKQHEKKYFVDAEGKLYWQKDKPVYIFVSESPDGKDAKRLESEDFAAYTNPLFLDTEGVNFIRTKWAVDPETRKPVVPAQEIAFPLHRDGIAPKVAVSTVSPNKYVSKDDIYYGAGLSQSANATDNVSGVSDLLFSINESAYASYGSELSFKEDGKYNVKFYAADNVGNYSEPKVYDFIVDLTAPSTNFSITGDKLAETLSPRTEIKLTSTDGASGVRATYYKLDDGPEVRFTGTIKLSKVAEGDHTLTYYSVDRVNNRESEKTYNFYMDRTAPEVVATVVGDQYQNRGRVFISTRTKVKLEASDNKSGISKIWYKIDGGKDIPYTEPFEMPTSKGKHTVEYYATDKVNNNFHSLLDESLVSRESLDIDVEAPEIAHEFKGEQYFLRDTSFITSDTDIDLQAFDTDSGVKGIGYKINGGPGQSYDEPFKLEEEGVYVIDFYGTDEVNNRNTQTFYFVVDNTGPEIEEILSMDPVGSISLEDKAGPLNVYSKGVTLYLGATDHVVDTETIFYSLNGGPEKRYMQPIAINTVGIVSYKSRAIDKLGNTSETTEQEIFIK